MVKTLKYKSDPTKRAFKINWLSAEELIKFKLVVDKSKFIKPTEEFLDKLYLDCRFYLNSQGFEFGDFTGCRVKLNKVGRLIEYGIEYKHIK